VNKIITNMIVNIRGWDTLKEELSLSPLIASTSKSTRVARSCIPRISIARLARSSSVLAMREDKTINAGWLLQLADIAREPARYQRPSTGRRTVYHCGSACGAALASRSVISTGFPIAPPAVYLALVITSIHFTLKAAHCARSFETSPARVAFSLRIAIRSLYLLLFIATPNPRDLAPLAARFTDGAALFQISTITGRRARSPARMHRRGHSVP